MVDETSRKNFYSGVRRDYKPVDRSFFNQIIDDDDDDDLNVKEKNGIASTKKKSTSPQGSKTKKHTILDIITDEEKLYKSIYPASFFLPSRENSPVPQKKN
jgi:hypothetical protein